MQHAHPDTQEENNNQIFLSGTIATEPTKTQTTQGENVYEFTLAVPRLSGMADSIPVMLPENLAKPVKGGSLNVKGQFRSYNKIVGDRSKLMLTAFATEVIPLESNENPNLIELTGYICKAPIYRTTPFNREIADLLVAVNRGSNKSDYIPAIAWGRNARFAKNLLVGEKVNISGRIQSREYQKRLDNETIETRTAYEISINSLERAE